MLRKFTFFATLVALTPCLAQGIKDNQRERLETLWKASLKDYKANRVELFEAFTWSEKLYLLEISKRMGDKAARARLAALRALANKSVGETAAVDQLAVKCLASMLDAKPTIAQRRERLASLELLVKKLKPLVISGKTSIDCYVNWSRRLQMEHSAAAIAGQAGEIMPFDEQDSNKNGHQLRLEDLTRELRVAITRKRARPGLLIDLRPHTIKTKPSFSWSDDKSRRSGTTRVKDKADQARRAAFAQALKDYKAGLKTASAVARASQRIGARVQSLKDAHAAAKDHVRRMETLVSTRSSEGQDAAARYFLDEARRAEARLKRRLTGQ